MAQEKIKDHPLDLTEDDLSFLSDGFKKWIEQVEDSRRERMHGIWEKAAKNYAGKAPRMQLPWPGASNAVLNITQSHTDSIQARLYAAGATTDPTYMISAGTGEPIILPDGREITAQKYAIWWQEISKHIEQYEVNHKKAMEEATWLTALYGDAWVYVSWVKDEVMDVSAGPDGKLQRTPRTITNQPVLTVLHPERVYLAPWEDDPQKARTIGFDFDLDETDLLIKERRNIYKKARVEELKKLLADNTDEEGSKLRRAFQRAGTFKEWGRDSDRDESTLRQLLDEQSGIDPSVEPRALKMLKVFSRVDLDKDGIPEEVQFEVEKTKGIVAMGRYFNLEHKMRPLLHFYYSRRPGSPNNLGVPEMLFNAQKILNNLIRDLINNNKVKNTKVFLAKAGSTIKKQSEIFPSRLFMVNDPQKDLAAIDLGSSGGVTGLNEIGLIQGWAERLTGVTEANLGIQSKSRTPVGTTQALLEEGSQRLDRVLDRQREVQGEMWSQVLALYRQNADPRKLARLAGIEEGDMADFLAAWQAVPAGEMSEYIRIRPEVSSNSFNRSAQQQKVLTVMGQVQQYYQQLMLLANHAAAATQAGDPSFRELVLSMAKGGHSLMQKFLSLHDEKEQSDLNPDALITLLEGVNSVGQGSDVSNSPADAAQGAATSGADLGESGEAAGRPSPGLPRVPSPTNGSPDAGGGAA